MSGAVLLCMVDSLRHDEIEAARMPFLAGLVERGCAGSLAPSFGFEPDGAYFAGLSPEECDGGAQFWRRPGARLFRATGLFGVLERLPSHRWRRLVRKGARAVAQWTARDPLPRRMAAPADIPFDQLARFSLSLHRLADDPEAWGGRSVFDIARARGLGLFTHCFPQHRVKTPVVVERFLREYRGGAGLMFLFFGDLDGIGHRHGPGSRERAEALRTMDRALQAVHQHALSQHGELTFLVFGDHGMAEVRSRLDIRPALARAGLDARYDTWFVDSTFARFWVDNETRRRRLHAELDALGGGRWIDNEDRARWQIRWNHDWFGRDIFAVNDHGLLHPSFYASGEAPLGMHGYLPGCRDNESGFVAVGPSVPAGRRRERADMRGVFHAVARRLGDTDPTHAAADLLA